MFKHVGLFALALSFGLTVASCFANDQQLVIPVEVYGDLHDRLVEKEAACNKVLSEKVAALVKLDGIWYQLRKLNIFDESGLRQFVSNVKNARGFAFASMVCMVFAGIAAFAHSSLVFLYGYGTVMCYLMALASLTAPNAIDKKPVQHVGYY